MGWGEVAGVVRHEREGRETDGYTWLRDGNWRWVEAGALTGAGILWAHLLAVVCIGDHVKERTGRLFVRKGHVCFWVI